jgi:hypothetical protein
MSIAACPATHRAVPTGAHRNIAGHPPGEIPVYALTATPEIAGSFFDVVELPDGSHAYLLEVGGVTYLCRQMVARHYGSGATHNTRTAPETLTGLIAEARCGASDRHYLRRSGRDIVGIVEVQP